jgi:4-amino-4-deoxy-L-arabinose transferase-like glycosyltransferase
MDVASRVGGRGSIRSIGFDRALLLIGLGALVVRVLYVLIAKQGTDTCGEDVCGDALYYSRQAELNIHGRFFEDPAVPGAPAADHPPLTALVLTPVSVLPGPSVLEHRLTMAVLGAVAVVVIGYLGRAVAGPRVGLLAAGLAAVYPNLWLNDGVIMSETLATLGTALVLLTVYRLHDEPSQGRAAVAGLVCGAAVLARGELALFLPLVVLPICLWSRSLPMSARLARFGTCLGLALLVVLPWTAWNSVRFAEPVTLATNDGLTLVGANCDPAYSGVSTGLWHLSCAQEVEAGGDQSQRSSTYRTAAFDYVRENSDRLPEVMSARLGRVWSVYEPGQMAWYNQGEGRERTLSLIGLWCYAALLALAVGGGVLLRRRRQLVWPLVATAVIVSLTAAGFYGLVRFRVPAEVAIVVLAGVAIDALLARAARSDTVQPEPAAPAP